VLRCYTHRCFIKKGLISKPLFLFPRPPFLGAGPPLIFGSTTAKFACLTLRGFVKDV
jgi:hypothetical protein